MDFVHSFLVYNVMGDALQIKKGTSLFNEVPFLYKFLSTDHANLVIDEYHGDIFHHYLELDQGMNSYFLRS